jgi:hypothetical protein
MKFQRVDTFVVTAPFATPTFIFNRHQTNFLSSFMNGFDEILPAITVSARFHITLMFMPRPSWGSAQPLALPTELSRNTFPRYKPVEGFQLCQTALECQSDFYQEFEGFRGVRSCIKRSYKGPFCARFQGLWREKSPHGKVVGNG